MVKTIITGNHSVTHTLTKLADQTVGEIRGEGIRTTSTSTSTTAPSLTMVRRRNGKGRRSNGGGVSRQRETR